MATRRADGEGTLEWTGKKDAQGNPLKPGKWRYRGWLGDARVSGSSFDSKREALRSFQDAYRRAVKAKADAAKTPPAPPVSRLPLADYCQRALKGPYLARVKAGKLVQETWDMYDGIVSNHLDGTPLGETPVEDVEREDVAEWIAALTSPGRVDASGKVVRAERPLGNATKLRYAGFLSGVFEAARREKAAASNPVRDAEKPTVDPDDVEFRILTLEECGRLLERLREWEARQDLIPPKIPGKERKKQPRPEHQRNRTVVAALLGLHGFGPGELLGMTKEDLKDGGLTPRRQGKNGKLVPRLKNRHRRRWVPIDDELLALVEAAPPGLLIRADEEGRRAMSENNLRRAYRWALGGTEFAGMTPYDLRHTFAMRLLEEGVDVQTAAELMRHSTDTFLRRYVRSREDLKRDAVRRARGGKAPGPTHGTDPQTMRAA